MSVDAILKAAATNQQGGTQPPPRLIAPDDKRCLYKNRRIWNVVWTRQDALGWTRTWSTSIQNGTTVSYKWHMDYKFVKILIEIIQNLPLFYAGLIKIIIEIIQNLL